LPYSLQPQRNKIKCIGDEDERIGRGNGKDLSMNSNLEQFNQSSTPKEPDGTGVM
jgi:hypothetical protein